jgi:riboflavin kinase/FMN adenylyltransferase
VKIYRSIDSFPSNIKTAITIGTFDGLHQGHFFVLSQLLKIAKSESLDSVLLTFYPHPRNVLFSDGQELKLLNTMNEKIQRLEKLGLQHLIIHEFTKEFSRKKALNFIRDSLIGKLNMQNMVIGHDHHFGRNREGSFEELKELSELYLFNLNRIDAQKDGGITVSSTKIRRALESGDVTKANSLLGYKFMISGTVIHGEKLGRKIGFPTANLKLDDSKIVPKSGVYVVELNIESSNYFGMLNISKDSKKIEVNIFNFSDQIYDKEVEVYFIDYLRDLKVFGSSKELQSQLAKDEAISKKLLKKINL